MVLNYQKILNFNNIIKITFFCLIEFHKLKKKKKILQNNDFYKEVNPSDNGKEIQWGIILICSQ